METATKWKKRAKRDRKLRKLITLKQEIILLLIKIKMIIKNNMKQLIYFAIMAIAIAVLINFEVVRKEHLVWSLTVFVPAVIQLGKSFFSQKAQIKSYKNKVIDLELKRANLLLRNDELFIENQELLSKATDKNDEEME